MDLLQVGHPWNNQIKGLAGLSGGKQIEETVRLCDVCQKYKT